MCDQWKDNYEAFYLWSISNGYSDNLTIDRIDFNGDYDPDNCRWVTHKEQTNNTRRNRFIEYRGERHTLSEWSEIVGISRSALRCRIYKYGWSINRAMETPVQEKGKIGEDRIISVSKNKINNLANIS